MPRLSFKVFSILILSGTFAGSFAATPPPEIAHPGWAHKATQRSAFASEMTMGSLHVRFEKTSLDDVLRAAAAGAIDHQGDAGASVYWLCFTNATPSFTERVWLVSDGEMGGNAHLVTGVSAQRLSAGNASADCPALPANLQPLALEHGVWLGASPRDFHQKFGLPSSRGTAWESYDYAGKVWGSCEGGSFDLTNSLLLRVRKKRIDFLQLNQTTSC